MNWIQYYMVSNEENNDGESNFLYLWLVDSFATFFFTCCAITDAFIVMISQEHNEAWLMHHQTVAHHHDVGERPSIQDPGLEQAMQQYGRQQTNSSQGRFV